MWPIQSNVDVDITYQFTVQIVLQLSGKFEGSSFSQKWSNHNKIIRLFSCYILSYQKIIKKIVLEWQVFRNCDLPPSLMNMSSRTQLRTQLTAQLVLFQPDLIKYDGSRQSRRPRVPGTINYIFSRTLKATAWWWRSQQVPHCFHTPVSSWLIFVFVLSGVTESQSHGVTESRSHGDE